MAKMLGGSTRGYLMPALQADATLSQVNPVSGTKYTVLAATKNCRLISASLYVTWTVQPDPLELHTTIDGNVITYAFTNPVSNSVYVPGITSYAAVTAQLLRSASNEDYTRSYVMEGRSILVEGETTGGTTSALTGRAKYAKW